MGMNTFADVVRCVQRGAASGDTSWYGNIEQHIRKIPGGDTVIRELVTGTRTAEQVMDVLQTWGGLMPSPAILVYIRGFIQAQKQKMEQI